MAIWLTTAMIFSIRTPNLHVECESAQSIFPESSLPVIFSSFRPVLTFFSLWRNVGRRK